MKHVEGRKRKHNFDKHSLDRLTNVPIMMIVEVLDSTSLGNTTAITTTTVIMIASTIAVMIVTSIRTTRVDTSATIVEVVMEANLQRKISVRLSVTSAIR